MSTKTSFKRIAAVAAVALTLGGFSAVSANAAVTSGSLIIDYSYGTSDSPAKPGITISTDAGTNKDILVLRDQFRATTAGAGSADTISITTVQDVVDSAGMLNTTYPYFDAAATNGADQTAYSALHNATVAILTDTTKATVTPTAVGATVGQATIKFAPALPGTYKFLISTTAGASYTWTVTAVAQKYNHSAAAITPNAPATTATVSGVTTLTSAATATTASVASVAVTQYNSTDTSLAASAATSQAVVVAITKGLVVNASTGSFATATSSVTTAAGGTGSNTYNVYANGTVGSATLTVTVGGTLLATYPVVFAGSATAMSVTGAAKWITPTANALTLTVSAKDSAGNTATSVPPYTCTSSNTAAATVSAGGVVSGVAAGDAVITCAANDASATSATWAVHVAPAVAVAVPTLTFDSPSYLPGQLMTITVKAEAADNAKYELFTSAATGNAQFNVVSGLTSGTTVALVSGVATITAYAPITSGDFTITGTNAAGAVKATATIGNAALDAAQAAQDAANEATDAANAATDAANNAMDSADAAQQAALDAGDKADAALAAITDLATKVSEIAAQVSALSAVVAKIAAAVAKISAKVKA